MDSIPDERDNLGQPDMGTLPAEDGELSVTRLRDQ